MFNSAEGAALGIAKKKRVRAEGAFQSPSDAPLDRAFGSALGYFDGAPSALRAACFISWVIEVPENYFGQV